MRIVSYNLTPRQRDALKWVVERVQVGDLQETFVILWDFKSTIHGGWNTTPPDQSREFDLATLEAWDRAGLVNVVTQERDRAQLHLLHSSRCTITQSAYDAVEADFTESEPEPNRLRLIKLLTKEYGMKELRLMAVMIGANHESIEGGTVDAYALDLIAYAGRRNLLWKLVHVALAWE